MAKAKKQKSGNWRVQLFLGRDEAGKQIIKSFTAKTKREAEALAAEYKSRGIKPSKLTMRVALDEYIEARRVIHSPATIKNYRAVQRGLERNCPRFMDTRVDAVDSAKVQAVINTIADSLSPRTVRLFHFLIVGTLRAHGVRDINVLLPRVERKERFIPSPELAKTIFAAAQGTELELPIILAAAGLRAGEICALTVDDFDGDTVSISKAMVAGEDRRYVVKAPKTNASYRRVQLPPGVADKIRQQGFVTKRKPDNLSTAHSSFLKKNGFPHFRLHDWRHFMVSSLHEAGIPDAYIMAMGGWSSEYVMKNVYRHILPDSLAPMAEKATSQLGALLPEYAS